MASDLQQLVDKYRENDLSREELNDLIRQVTLMSSDAYSKVATHGNVMLSREDCIQECLLRVLKYLPSYDKTKASAAAFIAHNIFQGLLDYVRNMDPLSRGDRRLVAMIYKSLAPLSQVLERTPNVSEIADHLGVPAEKIHRILVQQKARTSLGEIIKTSAESLPDESAQDPSEVDHHLHEKLRQHIFKLPPREAVAIYLSHFRSRSLEQVGEVFGLSSKRMVQIRSDGINQLRKDFP